MNRKRSNGSAALTPLPKSAVAARRASGARLLARQQRVAQAHPHPPGPERAGVVEPAHLHRAWPRSSRRRVVGAARARTAEPRCCALAPRPRPRARTRRVGPRPAAAPARAPPRTRSALARQISSSPDRSASARPRAPARAARGARCASRASAARAGSGAGTRSPGARSRSSAPGCRRSKAAAISAAGAPPCSARGSHGPRACSVGAKRSSVGAGRCSRSSGSAGSRATKSASLPGSRSGGPWPKHASAGAARPACARTRGCAPGPA